MAPPPFWETLLWILAHSFGLEMFELRFITTVLALRVEVWAVTGYWVVVKIMVPFWVPIIIRHLIFRVPKKGP